MLFFCYFKKILNKNLFYLLATSIRYYSNRWINVMKNGNDFIYREKKTCTD